MSAMAAQASPSPASSADVLNSWKEIAAYLKRGVRTVQRWEADLGLPVRRPRGTSRSAVIAVRSDIDQWVNSFPVHNGRTHRPQGDGLHTQPNAIARQSEIRDLIARSRSLRHDMAQSRDGLRSALDRLITSLHRIAQPQGAGEYGIKTDQCL